MACGFDPSGFYPLTLSRDQRERVEGLSDQSRNVALLQLPPALRHAPKAARLRVGGGFDCRSVLFGLALAALALSACGKWEENGLTRLNQIYPPPPGSGTTNGSTCEMPNVDGGPVTMPDNSCLGLLSGQWAVRFVQFGNISPLGPPAWDVTITDLFLAQLSSDKSSLQLTFCQEENGLTNNVGQPQTLGQNTTPQTSVDELAAYPLTVPLPNDMLAGSQSVWIWGVNGLADPATSALPTEADAGGIWEEDGGTPGVTVDVTSPAGAIYLVKRALFNFEAGTSSGGWITGPLQFSVEQNVLGATESILLTPAPITPRADCTSVYQFKCVDTSFTCADLVQNYQTMFNNAPN